MDSDQFPESSLSRPTGSGYGCRVCLRGLTSVFFDASAKGVIEVAVSFGFVELFDTHFAQAVFGVVVVVLGDAGSPFGSGSAMLVVAVVALSLSAVFFAN